MYDNRPVGIFDSGVGGLTILLEITKLLPNESIIYFADQKNIPYSGKSERELEKITSNIVRLLIKNKVKLIVIACNTATVYTIDYLRSKFKVPIIGVVPVVKTAALFAKSGRIGILSTIATSKSKYQKDLIKKFANGLIVNNIGSDEIVSFIETGDLKSAVLNKKLRNILKKFQEIEVLALGCSHYPILRDEIQKILGLEVLILDSGPAVARQVKRVLETNKMLSSKKSKIRFFTTGNPADFKRIVEKLINAKLDPDIIGVDTVEKAII